MTTPPASLITEKNKLSGSGAWLAILDVEITGEAVIRLVNNNEDIVWNGHTYQRFSFDLDTIKEDGQGGLPSYTIQISNINREYAALIDAHDGATDAKTTLRIIHSEHLDELTPLFEDVSHVLHTTVGLKWIVFTVGGQSPLQMLSPRERYLANHCRYKEFKGSKCGYTGTDGSCNRTFGDCRTKGNSQRFGGFPAISQGQGVYV